MARYTRQVWAADQPKLFARASGRGIDKALKGGASALYRFLENDLDDKEVHRSYVTALVRGAAVWFSVELYQRLPVLLPHVHRDNTCRRLLCLDPAHVKGRQGRTGERRDQWSTPTTTGYVRDDNSLIKALPNSLRVESSAPGLAGRKLGGGFVACHIWAMSDATDPWQNSFVPNLVWLPRPFDLYSDRQGHFVQAVLRSESARRYRSRATDAPQETAKIWAALAVPGRGSAGGPTGNEFVNSTRWQRTRLKKIGPAR
ncbi:MAG: hypothetical protein K0V04_10945 [Deltaproteobacteria bacterium]|nr:hypothetical protein [Deltaproteobacteria bacterium]